jgi:hypothetical protein
MIILWTVHPFFILTILELYCYETWQITSSEEKTQQMLYSGGFKPGLDVPPGYTNISYWIRENILPGLRN